VLRELLMADEPQCFGIAEFVEQLSAELLSAPLSLQYDDEARFRADVTQVVRRFAEEKLASLALPYCIQDWGDEALLPVTIFGTDFCPDIAIKVGELPVVAFILQLAKQGKELGPRVSSAVGQALIYSRYYPAVITFVLSMEKGEPHKHWSDRELKADLWRRHKIRLVVRE
jgi:hypothetical protein